MVYKSLNGLAPHYLQSKFTDRSEISSDFNISRCLSESSKWAESSKRVDLVSKPKIDKNLKFESVLSDLTKRAASLCPSPGDLLCVPTSTRGPLFKINYCRSWVYSSELLQKDGFGFYKLRRVQNVDLAWSCKEFKTRDYGLKAHRWAKSHIKCRSLLHSSELLQNDVFGYYKLYTIKNVPFGSKAHLWQKSLDLSL